MSTQSPIPLTADKIWDMDAVIAADGPFPGAEPDLRGEIHPDLIRYKGYWYCGLKEGHGGFSEGGAPLRRARIIRSADGEKWESVRVFTNSAGSVSDLKFSITAEGVLMAATNMGYPGVGRSQPHSRHPNSGVVRRCSVTWLTEDGVNWGTANACPTGYNTVRYEVAWHQGMGYSIGYAGKDRLGTLYRTGDGKTWTEVSTNIYASWFATWQGTERVPGGQGDVNDIYWDPNRAPNRTPSEAALAFDEDGTLRAVARAHPVYAIIGEAPPPYYDDWTWREARVDWDGDGELLPAHVKLGVQMGGPVLKYLSNGVLLAAARADASTAERAIGRMTLFQVDPVNAVLKKWHAFDGYSHYPGVVEHEDQLWISCGKQQKQDPFEVYLLKTPMMK